MRLTLAGSVSPCARAAADGLAQNRSQRERPLGEELTNILEERDGVLGRFYGPERGINWWGVGGYFSGL